MKQVHSLTKKATLALFACATLSLGACKLNMEPLPKTVHEEVQQALNCGIDGIIVYVNQPGNNALYSGGWHNKENQIPADPNALFKIGSISKMYMAAATAKLIAADKLALNNTLSQLIPEVANRIENADKITLRMMLQHRSGIPEYNDHADAEYNNQHQDYLSTAACIFDKPADFAPDKKCRQSNTNYLLLGEILDRVLGYSHHAYIKHEILDSLGLGNTHALYTQVAPDAVMSGYYKGQNQDLKPNNYTCPGASMVATAEDVGLFVRALADGSLLTPQEQAIYSSVHECGYTGSLPGYTSIVRYHSDIDAVVVQFVNTSNKDLFWLKLERQYCRILRILEKQ